jgi:DNA-binding NtrC family response regulator
MAPQQLSSRTISQLASSVREGETENLPDISSVINAEAILGSAFFKTTLWSGPEAILLVEDEPFVRKATAEILEVAGYTCLTAESGAVALKACQAHSKPIDLLISDIIMPGMTGQELAAEFHGCCPQGRVLLMSGYVKHLAWCELPPYGKTYLAKPFSMETLLKRVREVLDTAPSDWGAPA